LHNIQTTIIYQQMESQQLIDEKYMRLAIKEAHNALAQREVPIGALIVAGERIIGRGHNLVETLCDATAHAEMQAITAAATCLGGKYLQGCTLYVTVEPCVMCAGAITWSQVGRVVWGADDPKRGFTTIAGLKLHPKSQITRGVLAAECEALMQDFFKELRR
jgi:tRNA(adenine34) deaminase